MSCRFGGGGRHRLLSLYKMNKLDFEKRMNQTLLEKRVAQKALNVRAKKIVGTELEILAAQEELDEALAVYERFLKKD